MDLAKFIDKYGAQKDHHQVSMRQRYERSYKKWAQEIADNKPSEDWLYALSKLELTIDDAFFIRGYTGSCSSWLNSEKRNGQAHDSEAKALYADHLIRALTKLTSYTGTVWRWEEADEESVKFNWFKKHAGLIFSIPYFLSTSLDNRTAKPMLWQIQTIPKGHGRFVGDISSARSEQEVLFLPDAKFQINGVGNDNRTVLMQELPTDTPADLELCGVYYRNYEDIDPDMKKEGLFD